MCDIFFPGALTLFNFRTACSLKKIFGFVFPAARFEPGMAGYEARPLPLCYAVYPIHVREINPRTQQIKEPKSLFHGCADRAMF